MRAAILGLLSILLDTSHNILTENTYIWFKKKKKNIQKEEEKMIIFGCIKNFYKPISNQLETEFKRE